nr:MAG: ORF1 [TTV-like mini virus]
MPYYYRKTYWPRRRRFRRYWRRRPRKTFRRRFWRRHRWVRPYFYKRKAKKIAIKQYQPATIRKLKVKGLEPLFLMNKERLTNNLIQWLYSIAPTHFPAGGGFSITQYTLAGLYELHQKLQNWWTKSNCKLPLLRYNGCKFKLYRTQNYDYVFRYINCFPMKSTDLMYMSTQPSMLMLNKNSVFVPSLKHGKNKKPYKIVRVRPPSQMQTKWFFQHDLTNVPLVVTLASAASFDRYYMSSQAISTTIGFISLNTNQFHYHNFQNPATTGYHPRDQIYYWSVENGQHNVQKTKIGDLIYLGQSSIMQKGDKIRDVDTHADFSNKWDTYFSNSKYWGNIFKPEYFNQEHPILYSTKPPSQLKANFSNSLETEIGTNFQVITDPLFIRCRYNPLNDTGKDNQLYLVPNIRDQTGWDPLNNNNLQRSGFPFWLMTWGWLDWQKKLSEAQQIDINYISVLKTKESIITPKLPYYVPLDEGFLTNTSPYMEENQLTESDRQHYYPKGSFQLQTINTIGSSGPGTIKLPGTTSAEAKTEYTFYFKLGGCPPPMEQICNPAEQPIYPIPNNMHTTNSLQNPATAPETFLYHFDERNGTITKTAQKRMQKDWETKEPFFTTTGKTSMDLPCFPRQETSTSTETSDEEKETQTIQQQLQHQRRKQRSFQLRILRMLKQLTNSE